jgi:NADPH-dependent curcumin reductase CurA
MTTNRQILVKELPEGPLEERHFELREAAMPTPDAGEVLTRTIYLSLDPANRAWMQGATYRAPVTAGQVMAGFTLAEVVDSRDPSLKPGDLVECDSGWQEHAVHPARALSRLEPRGPLSHHVSVLGGTGLTAYFGMLEVGRPSPGETVLVSAAAGATGSVAGQIARIQGCRTVGVAGSDQKCAWLTGELGFDAAINYKTEEVRPALKERCPEGIDVYFDNTGGEILEAALYRMNLRGRVVCSGSVSQYDTGRPAAGPRGVPGLIVVKRLRMEGFIVSDYAAQYQPPSSASGEIQQPSSLLCRCSSPGCSAGSVGVVPRGREADARAAASAAAMETSDATDSGCQTPGLISLPRTPIPEWEDPRASASSRSWRCPK